MLDRIEAWRTKPTPVKQRYALTAAIGVTLLIVGIWSTTLPTRLAVFNFDNEALIVQEKRDTEPDIVPPAPPSRFSSFTASVADGYARLRATLLQPEPAPETPASEPERQAAWTEAVEAMQLESPVEGKPIMIAVATSTGLGSTSTSTATTSEPVLQ